MLPSPLEGAISASAQHGDAGMLIASLEAVEVDYAGRGRSLGPFSLQLSATVSPALS